MNLDSSEESHDILNDDHLEEKIITTEVHEFSSVPKTDSKLEYSLPNIEIEKTNEDFHHKNVLTFDFTDKHKSAYHDYHHFDHNYGHNLHHKYHYFYHYIPNKRRLSSREIEANYRDRIEVFKAFAQSFLNIGGTRS